MIDIIPTVVPKTRSDVEGLAARFGRLAPILHLDVTDGDFAFPTTWTPDKDEQLPASALWEVHLMASSPRETGERFIRSGAWRIVGHAEVLGGEDGVNTLKGWRAMGAHEVGIALKLGTPLSAVEHLVPHADVLHLMTIEKIGAQGQAFARESLQRIHDAHARYPQIVIAADGGINEANIAEVVEAGARRVSIGHALAGASDATAAYENLSRLAESALQ